ncbi:MAG: hypothetical protein JNK16_12350 [Phycisphaerales bacterium]|nr:hypothetical protein [Phycisphaerales bacterium]
MSTMTLDMDESVIVFANRRLPAARFPELIGQFLKGNPKTASIERASKALATNGFPVNDVQTFILSVCRWGGKSGSRVWGMVRKNDPAAVAAALKKAASAFDKPNVSLADAMHSLNQVKGLGAISYSSKVLRFLSPERCATFDSLLAADLGLPATAQSFETWSHDCSTVASQLNSLQLCAAPPHSSVWRTADVEASIFTELHPGVVSYCG